MKKAYFNWSSGKDSSLALYYSMKSNDLKVVSLFSVISSEEEKISMHEIKKELLIRQADAINVLRDLKHRELQQRCSVISIWRNLEINVLPTVRDQG